MYSNSVLRLFNNPKNPGRISKPDGIANTYNENETAHVEFSLRIENGIITLAQFRAQANPIIVAVCSTITQMLKGQALSNIVLDSTDILKGLEIEENIDIDFCLDCVKLAVLDYKEKQEKLNKNNPKEEFQEENSEVVDEIPVIDEEKTEEPIAQTSEEKSQIIEDEVKEKLININNTVNSFSLDDFDDDFGDDFFLDSIFDDED